MEYLLGKTLGLQTKNPNRVYPNTGQQLPALLPLSRRTFIQSYARALTYEPP